jgi:hypothetical protein
VTSRLGTGKPRTFFYSVVLLLLSLLLLASLLHVVGFSTVTDIPINPGGHAAVDNVSIVPDAAVIPDVSGITAVAGLPACTCWLHYFCRSSYCVGGPVVAFVSAVAGGHAIAVIIVVAA